jgi:crotonobetainyl-CoA:carnitine CoA-transferase CaiB-like acyl-CoA transferase
MTDDGGGRALPLAGIRVVEVATWLMVPAATGILADWGAEVTKIEHPIHGDPIRGLSSGRAGAGLNCVVQHCNRGKKSLAVDLSTDDGHEILRRLVREADVFVTNCLPAVRERLRIDVDHIRRINRGIVYARGSAVGPRGGERDRNGYDYSTFWCRSGVAHAYTQRGGSYPPAQNGGFGDGTTAPALAGGIAAALLQRERTGEGVVVDSSLLAMGMWVMSVDIENSLYIEGYEPSARAVREEPANPLVNVFKTADGRFLALVLLQGDRHWSELCGRLGRSELRDDPRFSTADARLRNRRACTDILDSVFATRPLSEWKRALAGSDGAWDVVQTLDEVVQDPQARANDYLVTVPEATVGPGGPALRLVASPVQFDETTCTPERSPEHGEHTEEILSRLGFTWDDITRLKDAAVVG